MRHELLDEVFHAYLGREEAEEKRWATPPSVKELARRHAAFQTYLGRWPLAAAKRRALLNTYEGHLLVKYAFSGPPHSSMPNTAH